MDHGVYGLNLEIDQVDRF